MDPVTTTTSVDPTVAAGILGAFGAIWFFFLVVAIIMIVAMWKVFTKAGKPGWAAIVPIYNLIVILEIVEKPIWWILLLLIPFVNIVIEIIVILELAKKFGKGVVFAIFGLILFPFIGWLMLAFGKAQYVGSAPAAAPVSAPTETPAA